MIRGIVAVWCILVLAGCLGARCPDPIPGGAAGLSRSPGGILSSIALIGTGLAGVGFLACAIAAIFTPAKLLWLKRGAACLGFAAACQFLYWFSLHVGLFAALAGVGAGVCGGAYLWLHRETLLRRDLDGDGHIGPRKKK